MTIVKNGRIYIRPYLRALQNQTYKKIEVVIQDGQSNDGTQEFIQKFKKSTKVKILLESSQDKNGAEAISKAIKRCSGQIVCMINADDILNQHACQIAIDYFTKQPKAGALYGANKLITKEGKYINTFRPMPFDLIKLLRCELVPTANGSFYNLKVCKNDFKFTSQFKTCGDLDLWLKLSKFPILCTQKVLASTRVDKQSSTRQAANYEQFCTDKIGILTKFINKYEKNIITEQLLKTSIAGVYAWAAESILNIEGKTKRFRYYINLAQKL
ncbi:glycosyltransferase [Candidatus Daviesbacteria bacterium]|nr:glycosyltransferase [Candidatus Daviesbacteria bacterium]